VEHALSRHPGVAEVAVWKRPDPEWGERVVAWIVATDPAAPPALGQLREMVAAQVAQWAAPKELVVVAELPRTASGKVRRTDLA
jgi:acyl-CoA synthetase (AMP-forming)/AMP-acid ligase II